MEGGMSIYDVIVAVITPPSVRASRLPCGELSSKTDEDI